MLKLYEEIFERLKKRIKNWKIENFYVVVIRQGKIKSIKRFGQGETGCSINPYDIGRYVKSSKGNEFLVCHNHPGGRLEHSVGDLIAIDVVRDSISTPLLASMVFTHKKFDVAEMQRPGMQ